MCSKQKLLAFAIFSLAVVIFTQLTGLGDGVFLTLSESATTLLTIFILLIIADFLIDLFKKGLKISIQGRYIAAFLLILLFHLNYTLMISSQRDALSEFYMNYLAGPMAYLQSPGVIFFPSIIHSLDNPDLNGLVIYLIAAFVWLAVYLGSDLLSHKVFPSERASSKPKTAKKKAKSKKQSRKR